MVPVQRIPVNGVELAVVTEGDGPPVLFIHGFPLDRGLWGGQMGPLEGVRRIAPDLRGMGESEVPDRGYSMRGYAADLAALLDALGEGEVTLVGLSMGGYVAFEFLRQWPERVRSLVLMDTRADADSPQGKQARDALAAAARERGAGAVVEAMLPRLLGPDSARDPALVTRVRAMMEATPVRGIVGALEAMRDRPDSTVLLPTLGATPVLLLVGEQDQITSPTVMRAMADRIPDAQFEVIPGAGHLPPLERPGAVTDRLRRFLGRG